MDRHDETTVTVEHLRHRVAELEAQLATRSRDVHLHPGFVFDSMFEGIQILDHDFRYVYLNETAAEHGRRRREELIGRRMGEVYPGIEQTEMFTLLRRCMTEHAPQRMVNQFAYPDGRLAWFDLRISPVPMGVLVLSVDVSEQKVVEERLRQSQDDLATTLDCMTEGVITTDVAGHITRMNPAAEALTGWPEAEGQGRPLDELVQFLDRNSLAPIPHPVETIARDGLEIGLADGVVLVARDGSHVPVAGSGAPIRDAGGALRGAVLLVRNMQEEYALTAMLQQSQKMEAVGRLAAGVAHDFNNLLTVILGYCAMTLGRMTDDDPLRDDIEEIRQAGERAASLTRQLLAFGRKQVLHSEVLDLNTVVGRMDTMLRRLIGEDVDFVTRLTPTLHPVRCDPGQIEQIVMNLAVNGRDAMGMGIGGKLTIETANVDLDDEYARTHPGARPGPHVMIAVTDTGVGMDAATQARIFEPFFTTKAPGQGTGLGLATVYGIVQQTGGNIWVYSEPGRGTTFKIYLPRADEPVTQAESPAVQPTPRRGTETVLVVEDEESVRRLIQRILETGGYTVLATGEVDEAIRLCRRHDGPIHALLTDVVLPKMDGRELARQALCARPELRVVYMSGYTDTAVVHHRVLEPGAAFVEKPIMPGVLLDKLGACFA